MNKPMTFVGLIACFAIAAHCEQAEAGAPWLLDVDYRQLISQADLIYERPAGAPVEGQPIGNGRMGTMVWTSPGAIHLQINRNDVFAVNKNHAGKRDGPADYCGGIAQILVDVGGEPFQAGETFLQRLSLYDAECAVSGEGVSVRCFVSAAADVLVLEVDDQRQSPQPLRLKVSMLREPEVKTQEHVARSAFADCADRALLVQPKHLFFCQFPASDQGAGRGVRQRSGSLQPRESDELRGLDHKPSRGSVGEAVVHSRRFAVHARLQGFQVRQASPGVGCHQYGRGVPAAFPEARV